VQLSLGLRIGSLQAEKLHVREQVHDSFPNAHGIYVQMVSDKSPAADSGIKVGDVITKIDKLELFNAQEFHELILDKPKRILRHGEGMPFTPPLMEWIYIQKIPMKNEVEQRFGKEKLVLA
uniref:PDZ domain-containing protein n=2 Tax=Aegilops tauschii subsp. strangulata TaxID=200361 RepID=A0A453KVB0_AEGTS